VSEDRAAQIIDFIRRSLVPDGDATVTLDTLLLTEGVIDSMGAVMLAAFVEERFGVRFDDTELRAGECETVADIARLVEHRRR